MGDEFTKEHITNQTLTIDVLMTFPKIKKMNTTKIEIATALEDSKYVTLDDE